MKMKSLLCNTLLVLSFIFVLSLEAFGNTEGEIMISLKVNEVQSMEVTSLILDSQVMVSALENYEQMGVDIHWNPSNGLINIYHKENVLVLEIDNNIAYLNGKDIVLKQQPTLIHDQPMIPLLTVAEELGFIVMWDEYAGIVHINQEKLPTNTEINETNFRQARIIDILLPDPTEHHTFVIKAESEITSIDTFETEIGNIVIDIHNATIGLEATQFIVEDSPNISLIRTSQFENEESVQVTRVVLEPILTSSVYSVTLEEDRKSVSVHFEENKINDISFTTTDNIDKLALTFSRKPDMHISNIYGENNLIIDIYNGKLNNIERPNLNGALVNGGSITQVDNNNVRISLNLKQNISYTLIEDDNTLTLIIEEPTFRNITFDRHNNAIVLTQPNNQIDINAFVHEYSDFHSGYTLTLPFNYSHFFGQGIIEIKNEFIDFIKVSTDYGKTTINIDQNRIIALNILENEDKIYINIIEPKEKYDRIVILDPGHVGHDLGAYHFGVMEKDLVLIISNLAKDLLEQNDDIKVYATRTTDVFVPLLERSQLANDAADLFVSIHLNAFTTEAPRGTETYYLAHETDEYYNITRREVAEIFQRNLLEGLGTVDRGVKTENFSVLRNTNIPSVLLELGFLSNPEENAFFLDPEIQQKSAQIIYDSIIEIFEIYTPPRY